MFGLTLNFRARYFIGPHAPTDYSYTHTPHTHRRLSFIPSLLNSHTPLSLSLILNRKYCTAVISNYRHTPSNFHTVHLKNVHAVSSKS